MKKRNSYLSIIATALVSAGVSLADTWIKDAATGCAIWNPNPSPSETIVWMGGIEDGKASGYGIATWCVKGKKTEEAQGQWRDGRLHGHAVWLHVGGDRYEGEWDSGAKHGCGIYTWADGTTFVGEYSHDQRSHGRIFLADGTPKAEIATAQARELGYAAEDAAILARKAATRAKIENARLPPTAKSADAKTAEAKECAPCPSVDAPEEDPSAK